jgi:hypothetical protein
VNAPIEKDTDVDVDSVSVPIILTTPAPTMLVRKALFAAQRDVEAVAKGDTATVQGEKDGRRYEYKYKFTSSEDMLAHCREVLHKHGLSWEMSSYEITGPQTGLKSPTLWGTFELVHAESGEMLTRRYPMPIASRNDDDKKIAGACTYLLGHATRLLLLVPKVSEEDAALNPDRRTASADDMPHSERRVIGGNGKPTAALPYPPRQYTDAQYKSLREDCNKLLKLVQRLTSESVEEVMKRAGMPTGKLQGQHLAQWRHWMILEIEIKGGAVPEWAREGDELDQRDREGELFG